jgi:hypothetical protein
VSEVRWIRSLECEALHNERFVEKPAVLKHVREKAIESIAALDVVLDADASSLQTSLREERSFLPEALSRLVRMLDLRSVHADQAKALRRAPQDHVDAVPIDDGGNQTVGPRNTFGGRTLSCLATTRGADGDGKSDRGGCLHIGSLWDDDDAMIEFTDRAIEILRRSHVAARRFNPDAWIRVFRRGGSVEFALAEGADEGDVVMEEEEFRIAVEQGLEGVVAVREPHDQLFLRPIGSEPAPGEVVDAEGH